MLDKESHYKIYQIGTFFADWRNQNSPHICPGYYHESGSRRGIKMSGMRVENYILAGLWFPNVGSFEV